MSALTIHSHKAFLPADYIGTLGGGLLPEIFESVHQYDTMNHHVIELAVPGMTSDDIRIELKNPVLWVSAQRTIKDPVSGKREVRGLPYQRTFIVPRNCEAGEITARCRNGMLTIKIKKAKRINPVRMPAMARNVARINWKYLQHKVVSFFKGVITCL